MPNALHDKCLSHWVYVAGSMELDLTQTCSPASVTRLQLTFRQSTSSMISKLTQVAILQACAFICMLLLAAIVAQRMHASQAQVEDVLASNRQTR